MSDRMTPEQIAGAAGELADKWLRAVGGGTTNQLNNQIEILVQASILVLGTNLGNAWKSLNWDQAMTARYLQMISNGVLSTARSLADDIDNGAADAVLSKEVN